jgi:hypothetical protein
MLKPENITTVLNFAVMPSAFNVIGVYTNENSANEWTINFVITNLQLTFASFLKHLIETGNINASETLINVF